ncbi:type II toxin-antitoxin system death-on-curing family toxin [Pelomonas aquatica]|uniref:Type II toxin-antitoxin system death-on-curing family toxin n=1 Tax=Pelomonas aquatica TaxID=431058 RepID=A0A9X4LJ59_9BURK|nr:type II toxin-antitoxin system death-on-curing family toxin [Pelomonas aquatica]MCY4754525.1 type II toxin-antitoxin system death-on-curing family toxin [Pelomonas aquatica]MDG0863649.1 type II toxin-antitoxin system death-on-curing family toxin [Pelomonas aquatica]
MSGPPRQWRWLNADVLQAVHLEQLAEHGGAPGTRDEGLFESALARPQNLALYGEPDAFDLAAAYAVGLAKNHPFIDGNKRTAYVAMELFLVLNGFELAADDASATLTMLSVAAGDSDELRLAQWLREHTAPR